LSTISGTHAVAVRHGGDRLDVADISGRIADGFAKHRASRLIDQLFDVGGAIARGKPHRHSLPRQEMREQRVGGPVELRHGHDVASELGHVLYSVRERRLAARNAQRFDAAFERGDAAFQHIDSRVADPAVAVTVDLEVEQRGAMFGGVERIGDRLIDWNRDRVRRGVALVAAVDRDGLVFHCLTLHDGTRPCDRRASPGRLKSCEAAISGAGAMANI
jgi:hypothetical protein